jgi:hypothetical protein
LNLVNKQLVETIKNASQKEKDDAVEAETQCKDSLKTVERQCIQKLAK